MASRPGPSRKRTCPRMHGPPGIGPRGLRQWGPKPPALSYLRTLTWVLMTSSRSAPMNVNMAHTLRTTMATRAMGM
jgi:hypothetical protein